MKKSKFTEEQIAYALKQVQSSTPVGSEIHLHRILIRLGVAELRRLRHLQKFGAGHYQWFGQNQAAIAP